jgi:hypothetical protein
MLHAVIDPPTLGKIQLKILTASLNKPQKAWVSRIKLKNSAYFLSSYSETEEETKLFCLVFGGK